MSAVADVVVSARAYPLEPVELVHTRVCHAKRKPCALCGKPKTNAVHKAKGGSCPFKRQVGCANCGKALADPDHLGAPESFNVFASGAWRPYQDAKKRWHEVLGPLLEASGLPKGLGHILAEGEVSFGDAQERDQGNYRVVIEKALGDTLVELGFLPDDTWARYEFGGLARRETKGVSRLRLMIFPSATPIDMSGDPQDALFAGDPMLPEGA